VGGPSLAVRESYMEIKHYLEQLKTQTCNVHYKGTNVGFGASKGKAIKKEISFYHINKELEVI